MDMISVAEHCRILLAKARWCPMCAECSGLSITEWCSGLCHQPAQSPERDRRRLSNVGAWQLQPKVAQVRVQDILPTRH